MNGPFGPCPNLIENIFHTYEFEVFIMKYMLSSTKINKSLTNFSSDRKYAYHLKKFSSSYHNKLCLAPILVLSISKDVSACCLAVGSTFCFKKFSYLKRL